MLVLNLKDGLKALPNKLSTTASAIPQVISYLQSTQLVAYYQRFNTCLVYTFTHDF